MGWPAVFFGVAALAAMGDTSPTTMLSWGYGGYLLYSGGPPAEHTNAYVMGQGIVYYA